MKGLLIKDLLVLRRYGRVMTLLLVFYGAFALLGDGGAAMSGMIAVVLAMTAVTSIAYDEQARWDRYACSLPVRRSQAVGAKYLLGLILTLTGCVLGLLISLAALAAGRQSWEDLAGSLIGSFSGAVLLLALMFPLIYRFGVEKSRILFLAILAVTGAVIAAAALTLSEPRMGTLSAVRLVWLKLAAAAAPVLSLLIYGASFGLSRRIYGKKEL